MKSFHVCKAFFLITAVFVLPCLQGTLFGQIWLNSYPWTDVCHYYYNIKDIDPYNVIPAIGGGYLMDAKAMFFEQDPEHPNAYDYRIIWKITETGASEWRKTTENVNTGYKSMVSDGQNYYYCLDTVSGNSFLDVYSAEMTLLGRYGFSSQNGISASFSELLWTPDGLILAGIVAGHSNIVKTDFQFNLMWQGTAFDAMVNGIITIQANAAGWLGITGSSLVQYTATGDTLWTKAVPNLRLKDLCVTQTNRIICAGIDQTIPDNQGELKLIEFAPADNSLSYLPTYLTYQSIDRNISLVENIKGDLILLAWYGSNYQIMYSVAADGTSLWSKSFFGDGIGNPGKGTNNIIATAAGNLVFCLKYEPFNWIYSNGICLVKANYLGETSGLEDSSLVPPATSISHYPNPVRNSLTFSYAAKANGEPLQLQIFNLKGQLLITKDLAGNSGSLSLNEQSIAEMANGIYLYRLNQGNKAIQTSRFTVLK